MRIKQHILIVFLITIFTFAYSSCEIEKTYEQYSVEEISRDNVIFEYYENDSLFAGLTDSLFPGCYFELTKDFQLITKNDTGINGEYEWYGKWNFDFEDNPDMLYYELYSPITNVLEFKGYQIIRLINDTIIILGVYDVYNYNKSIKIFRNKK